MSLADNGFVIYQTLTDEKKAELVASVQEQVNNFNVDLIAEKFKVKATDLNNERLKFLTLVQS